MLFWGEISPSVGERLLLGVDGGRDSVEPGGDKIPIHLPVVRVTVPKSLGERIAGNLQLSYLQAKQII